MKQRLSVLAAVAALVLAGGGMVHAEKPDGVGNGKNKKSEAGAPIAASLGVYFGDAQRRAVTQYFAPQMAAGKCPPGLAKKGNGCLPPGQAKKWAVGQRLPADVVTYPIPVELRVKLGVPPAGHEFVRVAGDILLIAVGTSMVIDAIEDLTR
jgi:hypothetical protein